MFGMELTEVDVANKSAIFRVGCRGWSWGLKLGLGLGLEFGC